MAGGGRAIIVRGNRFAHVVVGGASEIRWCAGFGRRDLGGREPQLARHRSAGAARPREQRRCFAARAGVCCARCACPLSGWFDPGHRERASYVPQRGRPLSGAQSTGVPSLWLHLSRSATCLRLGKADAPSAAHPRAGARVGLPRDATQWHPRGARLGRYSGARLWARPGLCHARSGDLRSDAHVRLVTHRGTVSRLVWDQGTLDYPALHGGGTRSRPATRRRQQPRIRSGAGVEQSCTQRAETGRAGDRAAPGGDLRPRAWLFRLPGRRTPRQLPDRFQGRAAVALRWFAASQPTSRAGRRRLRADRRRDWARR
jgi:hypothetical protein